MRRRLVEADKELHLLKTMRSQFTEGGESPRFIYSATGIMLDIPKPTETPEVDLLGNADFAALEARVTQAEADIDALETAVSDLEEAAQEEADPEDGSKFVHTFNHTGDTHVTSGWVGDWGFNTVIKSTITSEGNGFFTIAEDVLIARAWNNGNETGAGTFYLPGNQQGAVVEYRAVSSDGLTTATGAVGSGQFSAATLGLVVNGDSARIEVRLVANVYPNVVTNTAWFSVGYIIRTSTSLQTYIFSGSGGSTTRNEIDGV